MILKFESFSSDISGDIKDYFNNICDSGASIYVRNDQESGWLVTLEGDTPILEHDEELNFLDKIYLNLRGDEKDMIDNIILDEEILKSVRENPFFRRIFLASHLKLINLEIYAGGWTFEVTMHFSAI